MKGKTTIIVWGSEEGIEDIDSMRELWDGNGCGEGSF